MDHDRFDDLVRSLAQPASRRRAFGLLTGALATLAPASAAAKPAPAKCLADGKPCAPHDADATGYHRHGRDKGHGKGRDKGRDKRLSCTHCCSRSATTDATGKSRCACKREGESCANPSQCCGGVCRDGACTGCPGATQSCDGRCVDLQTNDHYCGACDNACDTGQRCDKGACVCDATSCADGCCDGATCQRGTSDGACGAGGAACQRCGAGQRCCDDGCATGGCCGDAECGAHARCDHHACVCDAGFHRCGDQCVSDQDVATCGTSCTPCPGSVCSPATCDGTTCGRAPIDGCCETDGECGDGNGCTTDRCDQTTHTCVHTQNTGDSCGDGGSCCGGACCEPPAHASPTCAGGTCGLACNAGFHRCGDQCVSDTDAAHCGASCDPCPTAPCQAATCDGTQCGLDRIPDCCATNGDCDDGNVCTTDTCEPGGNTCTHTPISDTPCGTDAVCCNGQCCAAPPNAIAACVGGACGFACKAGYGDCNGIAADGCETQLGTTANCQTCGDACQDGQECKNGTCGPVFSCDCANYNNCNAASGNGFCTETCTCQCNEPWTGADCADLPFISCADLTTCATCTARNRDGCVWCVSAFEAPPNSCTTITDCLVAGSCSS